MKDYWKYAILTNNQVTNLNNGRIVDTITFDMDFEPNEEYDVVVSYVYQFEDIPI